MKPKILPQLIMYCTDCYHFRKKMAINDSAKCEANTDLIFKDGQMFRKRHNNCPLPDGDKL